MEGKEEREENGRETGGRQAGGGMVGGVGEEEGGKEKVEKGRRRSKIVRLREIDMLV